MKKIIALTLASLGILTFTPQAKADIFDANVYCEVKDIITGQLALRYETTLQPHAGLDNGNIVQAYGGSIGENGIIWYYVNVLQGPNYRVDGKEGVVNAKYLLCDWYDFEGNYLFTE
ncbi:MAG: hypothetical protein WA865_13070 [Spirulinaceae cyanobacterium]